MPLFVFVISLLNTFLNNLTSRFQPYFQLPLSITNQDYFLKRIGEKERENWRETDRLREIQRQTDK